MFKCLKRWPIFYVKMCGFDKSQNILYPQAGSRWYELHFRAKNAASMLRTEKHWKKKSLGCQVFVPSSAGKTFYHSGSSKKRMQKGELFLGFWAICILRKEHNKPKSSLINHENFEVWGSQNKIQRPPPKNVTHPIWWLADISVSSPRLFFSDHIFHFLSLHRQADDKLKENPEAVGIVHLSY